MNIKSIIQQLQNVSGPDIDVYSLVRMAECAHPDGPESPGSRFLARVAGAVGEYVQEGPYDRYDATYDIADSSIPIYTHELWTTFVDLAAYQEDLSEYGPDASDLDSVATGALYQIADRLAAALFDWVEENS